MADSTTTNFGLTKPEVGASEDTWGAKINTDMDLIDAQMKASANAIVATVAVANAALAKAGGAMTGAITTNSTFDGVDVGVRDAVLTSTTTTANAALPAATGVAKDSSTGAASIPTGTTAQRPSAAVGMFRHNSTLNQFEGYNDGAWGELGGGGLLQVKNVTLGTIVTTSATIPLDNTIPQITEGAEAFTLAITPTSASSKLVISAYSGICGCSNNSRRLIMALFQGTTANALAVSTAGFQASGTAEMAVNLDHFMTAGTTDEITFRVRFGANTTSSASLNGNPTDGQWFGGVAATGMTISEISA